MALKAGYYLSEDLSQFVNFFTDAKDLLQSAEEAELSVELLRSILRRERKLTHGNIPLVHSILSKAISNRMKLLPTLNTAYRKAKRIVKNTAVSEIT